MPQIKPYIQNNNNIKLEYIHWIITPLASSLWIRARVCLCPILHIWVQTMLKWWTIPMFNKTCRSGHRVNGSALVATGTQMQVFFGFQCDCRIYQSFNPMHCIVYHRWTDRQNQLLNPTPCMHLSGCQHSVQMVANGKTKCSATMQQLFLFDPPTTFTSLHVFHWAQ